MATPEAKVKAKIRRRMEKLATESGLPLFWDTPPASEYGSGGRPDHTVRIGRVMFHIEAKAHPARLKKGQPTAKQAAFQAKLLRHGEYTLMVCGDEGVDQLYHAVVQLLIEQYTHGNLSQEVADAQAVLAAANELALKPVRKQASLDIAPGSGGSMKREVVMRGHKAT